MSEGEESDTTTGQSVCECQNSGDSLTLNRKEREESGMEEWTEEKVREYMWDPVYRMVWFPCEFSN